MRHFSAEIAAKLCEVVDADGGCPDGRRSRRRCADVERACGSGSIVIGVAVTAGVGQCYCLQGAAASAVILGIERLQYRQILAIHFAAIGQTDQQRVGRHNKQITIDFRDRVVAAAGVGHQHTGVRACRRVGIAARHCRCCQHCRRLAIDKPAVARAKGRVTVKHHLGCIVGRHGQSRRANVGRCRGAAGGKGVVADIGSAQRVTQVDRFPIGRIGVAEGCAAGKRDDIAGQYPCKLPLRT